MSVLNFSRKIFLPIVALFILFVLGVTIRHTVLDAQLAQFGSDMPFTLESALEFRYVRMLYEGEKIPLHDCKVQAPEGIHVRAAYTIAAEYVYALLAKCFPANFTLTEKVRWIANGWFCLGIIFMALWLWWWRNSFWAALAGGGYYAVSLAAVMRATGQELSHENFALPLLLAHLAFGVLSRKQTVVIWRRFLAIVSAVLLGLALCGWDLIQFYIGLWAIASYLNFVRNKLSARSAAGEQWLALVGVLFIAGLLNPYLRAHAFWCSPVMLLLLGMLPGVWSQANTCRVNRCYLFLLPLGLVLVSLAFAGTYGDSYSHFGELLWAKLRFLNQKPQDPALLTFAQRILWVPALNSTTWGLTKILFPVTIPLVFSSVVLVLCSRRLRRTPETVQILFYFVVTSVAFWLFFRFHVFLVICVAALLGCLVEWCAGQTRCIKTILLILTASVIVAEATHTITGASQWGAAPIYWRQQKELTDWLKENISEETILANFGLSAWLLAYGDYPIALHPKFENASIRERVQTYGELLFKGTEETFRDWADKQQAKYYIYALGEFSDYRVDHQMRYFIDALDPPPTAPARLFEYNHLKGRYFEFLWGNAKYRVFRIVTQEAQSQAETLGLQALSFFEQGAFEKAEALAQAALMRDIHNTNAAQVLLRLDALPER